MTYRLSIWYAATPDDGEPQTHDLSAYEVDKFVRPETGVLADLIHLEGKGVRKLTLEAIQ